MIKEEKELLECVVTGESIAAKAIICKHFGLDPSSWLDHPWLTAPNSLYDLKRCLQLIQQKPYLRTCIDSLAEEHGDWEEWAKIWDDLTLENFPKLIDLMKERINGIDRFSDDEILDEMKNRMIHEEGWYD